MKALHYGDNLQVLRESIPTARGRRWHPTTVKNLLDRGGAEVEQREAV